MKFIEKTLPDYSIEYPLEQISRDTDCILFFDIETTGLSSKFNSIYMIGCQFYKAGYWHYVQWFAEQVEDEPLLLNAFFEFIKSFYVIVHYNGNRFDIPFVLERCKQHDLNYNFYDYDFLDLLEKIRPYKNLLQLDNLKQKTLERHLGIRRNDSFDGGELIAIYEDYLSYPDEDSLDILLLHNAEDLQGLPKLLSLLSLQSVFEGHLKVKKVQTNSYHNLQGKKRQELLIFLALELPVAIPIQTNNADCYLKIEGNTATIKVPVYEEELKYFYADYKNYYYLPKEDTALHKAVASFVEKEYRIQATASTCYTKKRGLFLPQWQPIVVPFFKQSYESKELYFEIVDEIKKDRELFTKYTMHLLSMFLFYKK